MPPVLVSASALPAARQGAPRPPRRTRTAADPLPDSVVRLLATGGTTPIVAAFQSSV